MHLCPYSYEFCNKWECPNNYNRPPLTYSWEDPKQKDENFDCLCMCDCDEEKTSECAYDI